MAHVHMDLHELLKTQLDSNQLSIGTMPSTPEQWTAFLKLVNTQYQAQDAQSFHALGKHKISSASLETTPHINGLGYWSFDGLTNQSIWSKEMFSLFGYESQSPPPTVDDFMARVHEDDRTCLMHDLEQALHNNINYETEFRFLKEDGTYYWYRTIGQCLDKPKQLAGIIIDMQKQKTIDAHISELNKQLLDSARRAGMAEVATYILHNIGNVLTSSNVSINILKDNYNLPHHAKFFKVLNMLCEHADDLQNFLLNDVKGRLIPQYLVALTEPLNTEYHRNSAEIDCLIKDLNHIKDIVAMQQPISGVSSILEPVDLHELIHTALMMSINGETAYEISIVKNLNQLPKVELDKSKLLQILINLIQNAKDALLENNFSRTKEIAIHLTLSDNNSFMIRIADNGIGIHPELIDDIFNFGFTTKKTGHGFGLHSAALSAREMGGSLSVESKGQGAGASFRLILPFKTV